MLQTIEQILGNKPHEILIEIAVIWFCVYLVVRFLRGTRGAGIVKGFAVLAVVVTLLIKLLGQATESLGRLNFIYDRFVGLAAILLIVVFQPELRQFMIRLGHTRIFRATTRHANRVADAVSEAVQFLSKSQFGALIAIERSVGLGGLIEGGERLDAEVTARLLGSIFWPNSPLPDLGVIIRGDRILAANVQFPLAEEGSTLRELGSRHRAAVGITLDSDCLAVVVSEETGAVSIVEQGAVQQVPRERFHRELLKRLEAPAGSFQAPRTAIPAEKPAGKVKRPNAARGATRAGEPPKKETTAPVAKEA